MADDRTLQAIFKAHEEVRTYDLHYSNARIGISVFVASLGTGLAALILGLPAGEHGRDLMWVGLFGPEVFFWLAIFVSMHFYNLIHDCDVVGRGLEKELADTLVLQPPDTSNILYRTRLYELRRRKKESRRSTNRPRRPLLFADTPQQVLVGFSFLYAVFWLGHFRPLEYLPASSWFWQFTRWATGPGGQRLLLFVALGFLFLLVVLWVRSAQSRGGKVRAARRKVRARLKYAYQRPVVTLIMLGLIITGLVVATVFVAHITSNGRPVAGDVFVRVYATTDEQRMTAEIESWLRLNRGGKVDQAIAFDQNKLLVVLSSN